MMRIVREDRGAPSSLGDVSEQVPALDHRVGAPDDARQRAVLHVVRRVGGVGAEHERILVEPDEQRLVPGRVARRRVHHEPAVAEHVVACRAARATWPGARSRPSRRRSAGRRPASGRTAARSPGRGTAPAGRTRCRRSGRSAGGSATTMSMSSGFTPMPASCGMMSSSGFSRTSKSSAAAPSRARGSCAMSGWAPRSNSTRPCSCSIRNTWNGTVKVSPTFGWNGSISDHGAISPPVWNACSFTPGPLAGSDRAPSGS